MSDWTYFANLQNDKDNATAALARDQANAAAQAKQVAQDRFNAELGVAKNQYAPTVAAQYFSDRGLPMDQGLVNSIIQGVNVPSLDPNPMSYFTPDVFATGLAKSEQARRSGYTTQVNNMFKPGFERTLLPDSSIDPIVNSILGNQQSTAQTILDYNQKRGLLNPTGYKAAQDTLSQQASAGRSTLNDLANSVLGKERQALTDIKGEAGDLASGWSYGAPTPDFSPYYGRATDLAGKDITNLEGSIRGALGSTNLFDVPSALAKGGTAQGPIDLTTAVQGPVPFADQKKNQQRGLGTTGVF